MGQYYHPTILKNNWKSVKQPILASLYSHDYGNGLKLMEHSYVGNTFVGAVMKMIDLFDTKSTGVVFAWVGDYADPKNTKCYPIKDQDNPTQGMYVYGLAGDWMQDNEYKDLKDLRKKIGSERHNYKYIINRTKKQYVIVPEYNEDLWLIHPLPILTADGNGRGRGDYHTTWYVDEKEIEKHNAQFVGIWAYDKISVSNNKEDIEGLEQIMWEEECEE